MNRLRIALLGLAVAALLWSLGAGVPAGRPTSASAQGAITCPNGQLVLASQGCYGMQQPGGCPGYGVTYSYGNQCPTVCPNGQIVAQGQPCPGGQYSSQLYPCPGTAVTVTYGSPCPPTSGTTYTCPGTSITLPVGTPCPGQAGNGGLYTCPGSSVLVPYGTPCNGACPASCTGACPTTPFATSLQGCTPPNSTAPTPPPSPPAPSLLVSAASTYSTTASYSSGWNIVAAPTGTFLPGMTGWLYTFQPGDPSYEVVQPGAPLRPGAGYWAYAPAAGTNTLAPSGPTSVTIQIPPRQYAMIGNPGNTVATVSGADVVLIYNSTSGAYTPTTQLLPGQGGWAGSVNGGQITITNAPA
jgi:hypothetical protein